MRVFIPDDLTDEYDAIARAQGKPLELILQTQLRRFVKCPPGGTELIVSRPTLTAIAERTGGMPIRDEADLLKRFNRLAGISFQKINIDLSPAQLEVLESRAKRQGQPVKVLVQEIWTHVREAFNLTTAGVETKAS